MGARFAPMYTNLYRGNWEEHFIFSAHNPYRHLIKTYFRYTDDLIFIVNKDLMLEDFLTYLNNNSLNFTFTREEQNIKINYLDITLMGSLQEHRVKARAYRDPT